MSEFNRYTAYFFCCSVRSVMHKYLEKKREVNFDKIFNQMFGEQLSSILCRYRDVNVIVWFHLVSIYVEITIVDELTQKMY